MKATKFLISTAAAVSVAGAIGLAYAQTTPGTTASPQTQTTTTGQTPASTPGTTASPQTPTTTTGQTPANAPGTPNQPQNAAPGSMTTAPAGSSNTSGTATPRSTGRNMNDGTTGMATERNPRADRN